MSQGEIARELNLSTANIGYHLNLLKKRGLLKATGTHTVRGGTATRYTYNLDTKTRSKTLKLGPATWQALATELSRRAAFFRSGTQVLSDTEIWIDPKEWHELSAEMLHLSSRIHKAAKPKNHRGTIKVNMTVAMFEMKA